MNVTSQQIRNLRAGRLGGVDAETQLVKIVNAFAEEDGNYVLLIRDQEDLVIGLFLQSRAQKLLFKMYGQNVVFDWTHNTNNLGFYLGKKKSTVVQPYLCSNVSSAYLLKALLL